MSDLETQIAAATARVAAIGSEMELCLKSAADCEQQARDYRKRYGELKEERATLNNALVHNQTLAGINRANEAAEAAKAATEANQKQSEEILKKLEEREKTLAQLQTELEQKLSSLPQEAAAETK